jgi:hypothetical protein
MIMSTLVDCLHIVKSLDHSKIRLGPNHDGGYVILDGLHYDTLISCGIGYAAGFELAFLEKYDIPCLAFDGTVEGGAVKDKHPNIKFFKKNIGASESEDETNLHSLIEENDNMFLQMDIEGHEFAWLHSLSEDHLLKFNQMVFEFHARCCGMGPYDEEKISALKKITQTHYLVHVHGNNHGGSPPWTVYDGLTVPNGMEATYVKKSLLPNVVPNDEPIPGPLDFANGANTGMLQDIALTGPPYTWGNHKLTTM